MPPKTLRPPSPTTRWLDSAHIPNPIIKAWMGVFSALANHIEEHIADGPEKATCLRKLLEAKDCCTRAVIDTRERTATHEGELLAPAPAGLSLPPAPALAVREPSRTRTIALTTDPHSPRIVLHDIRLPEVKLVESSEINVDLIITTGSEELTWPLRRDGGDFSPPYSLEGGLKRARLARFAAKYIEEMGAGGIVFVTVLLEEFAYLIAQPT